MFTSITTAAGKPRNRQPLASATTDDALLTLGSAGAPLGLSPSSVRRLVAAGELTPIRLSARCTRYRAGEVTGWARAKAQQAGAR